MTLCVLTLIEISAPDEATITFVPKVGEPVPGAGLPEAPIDGQQYARKDAAWAVVAAGGADSIVRTKTASGVLSGHRIVRDVDGVHVAYLDASDISAADDALGMTLGAAADGAPAQIVVDGDVIEPSWTWTPHSPVFVTGLGLLTQIPPASPAAFSLQVGYATSATSMRVCIGLPIAL